MCPYCNRKHSNSKNLRKHHLQDHLDQPQALHHSDRVFDYSCALMTLGLIRSIHNRAIQLGDGQTVILLYKLVCVLLVCGLYAREARIQCKK